MATTPPSEGAPRPTHAPPAHASHGAQASTSLVTGGAGFIGSHLCDVLLAQGGRVVVVDDLSTGRRENLPPSHDRLTFLHETVSSATAPGASLDRLAREGLRITEIYHLAAAVGVRLVVEDPGRCIETNVAETSAILRFARRAGNIPTLIASSSEVYGKSDKAPFREDDDVVYGPTTVFRWAYACSKAIDEHLALATHAHDRLPVVVARFFNTVGPRQLGEYGMVLPRMVRAALAGQPLEIYGDGSQTRCFCDVRNVAEALPRLLRTPDCVGRVFNVGSDRSISIKELASAVLAATGSASSTRFIPYDVAYASGFEDLRQRKPDLARIRQAIGFDPSIPLERTIKDVSSWLRAQGSGAKV
jgi:UDP-glucose 4-epimerase